MRGASEWFLSAEERGNAATAHPGRLDEDVAFVGGIDLCHGRRDDERHEGDPQAEVLDPAFGPRPPWHDTHAEVHGPAVADLVETFLERWNDRAPLERGHFRLGGITSRATGERGLPDPLPPYGVSPPATGGHAVQVLRTYPTKRPAYPFAPDGERSIARMYSKARPGPLSHLRRGSVFLVRGDRGAV
jgi:phosphatidylserine/phosphatidylglycerophosphate/cardiolipin synthase-like enzyme